MESAFFGCENLQVTAPDVPELSGVSNMYQMFQQCAALNSPANINTWNTAAVISMPWMFRYASAFNNGGNNSINNWNTAAVMSMIAMFDNASAFNQNIGSWNTAAVTNMSWMFNGASAFSQNIGSWTLNPGVIMENMLDNCGMDCINYSATLTGWNANSSTPNNLILGADGMQYGAVAVGARTNLTGPKGWTITGDVLTNEACGAIWTGTVNTNWHEPGNWVGNAVPTAGSIVTIPSTVNKPVIQQDAVCLNLTIASGATVTINQQYGLTVFGVLTNNTVNGLVIKF